MFAVLGIILLVAGAILTFAVERSADGVDLNAIGWILMGGGAIALLAGIIQGAGLMASRRTNLVTERHVSGDGQHFVEEVRAD